jgi:hypothetical protein
LRALRVTADPVQLPLLDFDPAGPGERWWGLPDATRLEVLALLARLITRGVLAEPDTTLIQGPGEPAEVEDA